MIWGDYKTNIAWYVSNLELISCGGCVALHMRHDLKYHLGRIFHIDNIQHETAGRMTLRDVGVQDPLLVVRTKSCLLDGILGGAHSRWTKSFKL